MLTVAAQRPLPRQCCVDRTAADPLIGANMFASQRRISDRMYSDAKFVTVYSDARAIPLAHNPGSAIDTRRGHSCVSWN